jgi:hypothetical protein
MGYCDDNHHGGGYEPSSGPSIIDRALAALAAMTPFDKAMEELRGRRWSPSEAAQLKSEIDAGMAPVRKRPATYTIHGGVFTDTSFTEIEPGTEERYGPFETYEEAVKVWRGRAGWKVDTCTHRLFVLEV